MTHRCLEMSGSESFGFVKNLFPTYAKDVVRHTKLNNIHGISFVKDVLKLHFPSLNFLNTCQSRMR